MCGIIGYAGGTANANTLDVLVDGLSNLEYRGYDSAGIAMANGTIEVIKAAGELSTLEETVSNHNPSNGTVGIGHTRWSTHGPPSQRNAHPHTDENERVAVVHNGIIENYRTLRAELRSNGIEFESETDTEVIPHLIAESLDAGTDNERAFRDAIARLEGSYAVAAVFAGSGTLYATRHESPLVLGLGSDGYYVASDVPAFIEHTDQVVYLEDDQFVTLGEGDSVVTDPVGTPIEPDVATIRWDPEDAGKSGYEHYMLKEIQEQPNSLRECLRGRVDELNGRIELDGLPTLEWEGPVRFVACGTSYHASMFGARLLERNGIAARAQRASEFHDTSVPIGYDSLVIGVTQSGETADTLRALREANRSGTTTVAITNVVGSSASRIADHAVYIRAGPEIGVAATKTFASQQVSLSMATCSLVNHTSRETIRSLRSLPDAVQTVLDTSSARQIAQQFVDADSYFFIGKELAYPVALEGALKMKEITYKHAEGFAAGELKHGPLALVTENTPVFAIVLGDDEQARKTVSNVIEVQSRGAPVVAVTDGHTDVEAYADHVLSVPTNDPLTGPIVANVQLQLLAYWVARELGRSIDKPRHLAKSVTVE